MQLAIIFDKCDVLNNVLNEVLTVCQVWFRMLYE